jgi:uncharacterized glyoxalase superfamily protein PhnB
MMSAVKPNNASWLSPYITVKDVDISANFYCQAFHFEIKNLVPGEDGTTSWHGELNYKDQLLMIGKQGAWDSTTKTPNSSQVESPINLYLYCEDVDKFHQHAVNAGAVSLGAPEDMFWGDRMCRLKDIDGYIWCFATHIGKPT